MLNHVVSGKLIWYEQWFFLVSGFWKPTSSRKSHFVSVKSVFWSIYQQNDHVWSHFSSSFLLSNPSCHKPDNTAATATWNENKEHMVVSPHLIFLFLRWIKNTRNNINNLKKRQVMEGPSEGNVPYIDAQFRVSSHHLKRFQS